eukprot:356013-Chlamydomonas_euryale.AAC.3
MLNDRDAYTYVYTPKASSKQLRWCKPAVGALEYCALTVVCPSTRAGSRVSTMHVGPNAMYPAKPHEEGSPALSPLQPSNTHLATQ